MSAYLSHYVKARAEERERVALREYRDARRAWRQYTGKHRYAFLDAFRARVRWCVLHELLNLPSPETQWDDVRARGTTDDLMLRQIAGDR